MTTRLKCYPSEMQVKGNFWEGQSVPDTWKLKIMSIIFGYAFTEKWTQVTAAQRGTHELAQPWCKQSQRWRRPVVKHPCVTWSWCIMDLSPWIISLLSWRGELGEGRHWRTINTQAPSLQGRLWQQNRGPSPHPLPGQLTCNQSSAVRRVVLCEGRDGMGLTRSCNWFFPQLEVTIKLWA